MNDDKRDHLRALHEAYVECSGIPVSLSYERRQTLREFDRREFTADDVRAVINQVKAWIARGDLPESSLDWRNAMAKVDQFEERALKIRQARSRRAGAKRQAAAQAPRAAHRTLPDGSTLAVIATPAATVTDVPVIDLKKALHKLAEDVGRGR